MKKIFGILVSTTLFSASSFSEPVFRIQVGNDYKRYDDEDLKRRVWELERAVSQLQQKVFQLENRPVEKPVIAAPAPTPWVCTVVGFGKQKYSGSDASKAIAKQKAETECQTKEGSAFHCKEATCEQ
jgi:hypothetical protein